MTKNGTDFTIGPVFHLIAMIYPGYFGSRKKSVIGFQKYQKKVVLF